MLFGLIRAHKHTQGRAFLFALDVYLVFPFFLVSHSLLKCENTTRVAPVCPCSHCSAGCRSAEELFEWQVGGMALSDCADNGILVSLQIVPQEMAENCFWIKVKEEKLENPDLFAQLSLSFSSQSKGKEASSRLTLSLINPRARSRTRTRTCKHTHAHTHAPAHARTPHLASGAIDAKPLSSRDTLGNNFSH